MKLSKLPLGVTVYSDKAVYDSIPIEWIVVQHNVSATTSFEKETTVLLSKYILSFKAFDSIETVTRSNFMSALTFGSNDYGLSNIREWLNGNSTLDWGIAENRTAPIKEGVCYNPYADELGFMNRFEPEFVEIMRPMHLNSNNQSGFVNTLDDLVALPSLNELGFHSNLMEGDTLDYFNKRFNKTKRRVAFPIDKALERASADFVADHPHCSPYKHWGYLLRSIDENASMGYCRVSTVTETGKLGSIFAFNGSLGIRPMITIEDCNSSYQEMTDSYKIILK